MWHKSPNFHQLNEANASDVSGREKLERMGFDRFEVVVDDANHWAKVQPLDEKHVGISSEVTKMIQHG